MPTYRFVCKKCALMTEKELKYSEFSDPSKYPLCQSCGSEMDKVWISPEGGFILKGEGWHKKGGFS